jgi:hypothetical protein
MEKFLDSITRAVDHKEEKTPVCGCVYVKNKKLVFDIETNTIITSKTNWS